MTLKKQKLNNPKKDEVLIDEIYNSDTKQTDIIASSTKSSRIITLDDLIKAAKIDLDKWEITEWKANKWEVGAKDKNKKLVVEPLYQVYAKLKPRFLQIVDKQKEQLIEDMKKYSPDVNFKLFPFKPHVKKGPGTEKQLTLNLFDLHFDKLAWSEETGGNYDTNIAATRFKNALLDLTEKTFHYNVRKIIFIVGNDFFNTDTAYPYSATTGGTPQDTDLRWQKSFREGRRLIVEGIQFLSNIAPVKVLIVPGNHDWQKSFYLGDALECYFHNDVNVEIDNRPTPRKYHQYGKTLIGYTHSDKEKPELLAQLMSIECSQIWGETKFREFHLADKHHKKEKQYNLFTLDQPGITLRWMRSLTSPDAWHNSKGFKGNIQGAEAFIIDQEHGIEAQYYHNINSLDS